ncbi:MAG: hypothetical protein CVV44_18705 [Spirochaetae bacterium HGW-Spirochaetae-1]|jgi:hypothetical protein|nr:MAG: hypothetical protein CVV44_18705 [Spirochaetae bacterium HGW-Spirochaetae-1]
MKKIALILLALIVVTAGCKKSVESEKKAWESNLKKIDSLAMEFPSYATILKDQVKKAEPVMKAAEILTDEEAKIKKISEANGIINALFVRNLDNLRSLKQSIRSKIIEVRGLRLEYSERYSADRAIADAETTIQKAEERLKTAVNNAAEGEALSDLVTRDLKYAVNSLESVIKMVRDREREAQRKIDEQKKIEDQGKTSNNINSGGTTGNTIPQPADIKCSYCGTINPAGSKNCKGCGAAF